MRYLLDLGGWAQPRPNWHSKQPFGQYLVDLGAGPEVVSRVWWGGAPYVNKYYATLGPQSARTARFGEARKARYTILEALEPYGPESENPRPEFP